MLASGGFFQRSLAWIQADKAQTEVPGCHDALVGFVE